MNRERKEKEREREKERSKGFFSPRLSFPFLLPFSFRNRISTRRSFESERRINQAEKEEENEREAIRKGK